MDDGISYNDGWSDKVILQREVSQYDQTIFIVEVESSFFTMEITVEKTVSPQGPLSNCSGVVDHITSGGEGCFFGSLVSNCASSSRGS